MRTISLTIHPHKSEIQKFLDNLKAFIHREDFDPDTDFVLISKKKDDDEEHSTPYTLITLNYDREDIIECLKQLKVTDFSEKKLDRENTPPPFLYVFGQKINDRDIYIKINLKGDERKYIVCVSFHYANGAMTFPFA